MSSIRSFIPLQKLGQGTYSNVYKVRRVDDNEIYALKKVKLSSLTQKQKQNSLNEVRILASIQSPNIVAYKQAFFDQSLNVLCVVMQYANDGDVQKMIKSHSKGYNQKIDQKEIWLAAEHILKGLEVLHSRGILHRDLKCANIFKHNGIYKLGDLNVSKVNSSTNNLCYTQTGTPYYASPQVWRDQPYDSKSDIWSFGCILYQMAALKPPFNGKDMEELFRNVQKAKVARFGGEYSAELWEFVSLCLQKDAQKRPSAPQLLKYLKKYHCETNGTSGMKIISQQQNKLLKTIKVPKDMKKLNEALPISKYKKQTNVMNDNQRKYLNLKNDLNAKEQMQKQMQVQKKLKSQKSFQQKVNQKLLNSEISNNDNASKVNNLSSRKKQPIISSNEQKVQNDYTNSNSNNKPEPTKKTTQNKSAIYLPSSQHQNNSHITKPSQDFITNSYRSPKNHSSNNNYKLAKSPASQVRLGNKVQNSQQRLQQSDRKPSTASKVEKMQKQLNQMTELLKKPISMPRTEKTLVNSSHLVEPSFVISAEGSQLQRQLQQQSNRLKNNHSYLPTTNYRSGGQDVNIPTRNGLRQEVLDDWRNKLVKKNRILSSGISKPSWW